MQYVAGISLFIEKSIPYVPVPYATTMLMIIISMQFFQLEFIFSRFASSCYNKNVFCIWNAALTIDIIPSKYFSLRIHSISSRFAKPYNDHVLIRKMQRVELTEIYVEELHYS